MKITSVRAFAHAAPTPDMRGDSRNYCYVCVETDEGITGWGEATCGSLSVITMVEELGALLVGESPASIERHWQRMFHCQHNIRGGIIHMAALSGIDVALWDIKGKLLGVPLYELLGGAMRQELWCYSRFDGATPDAAVRHARREVARGFTALKGDPFVSFGPDHSHRAIDAAAAIVHAVRDAVGPDVELLVEAHGRLALASSLRFLDAVRSARIYLFEEPLALEDIEGLSELRRRTDTMIATGERLFGKWSFVPILERRLADLIQPDPAHAGGITELRKIAGMAEAHHVYVQPHNPYGPINSLAAAHLSAAIPNFLIMELILEEGMHDWFDLAVGGRFPTPKGGHMPLPTGPGLGHSIDVEALMAYPAKTGRLANGFLNHAVIPSRQGSDWR